MQDVDRKSGSAITVSEMEVSKCMDSSGED
jgi:hypothetical protein